MASESAHETVDPKVLPSLIWLFEPFLVSAKRVKQSAIYTQLDLVAMGIAGSISVMILLSLPASPAPLVVGLIVYSVYIGDRIRDIRSDPEATADRISFVSRHQSVLSITSAIAYGIAIAISVFGGPVSLGITLIPGACWIVYASDLADVEYVPLRRLKQIFLLNSSVVAFAWATVLVLLPLAFADSTVTPVVGILLIYFFVDVFINTEIPNVRDRYDDAKRGISTVPTVVGVRRTRHILYLMNGLLILFLIGTVIANLVPMIFAIALLAGRAVAVGVNAFVGRTDNFRRLEVFGVLNHVFVGVLLVGFVVL